MRKHPGRRLVRGSVDREPYMRAALDEAHRARGRNEVPIGAVIVREDRILARAHNETVTSRDPSAHAEIIAIRRAAAAAGNHRLAGTTLYVTLEPCMMCFGAILQARIPELVYGAGDPKTGGRELFEDARRRGILHSGLSIAEGVLREEASELLRDFFRERRK